MAAGGARRARSAGQEDPWRSWGSPLARRAEVAIVTLNPSGRQFRPVVIQLGLGAAPVALERRGLVLDRPIAYQGEPGGGFQCRDAPLEIGRRPDLLGLGLLPCQPVGLDAAAYAPVRHEPPPPALPARAATSRMAAATSGWPSPS